tara:strand:+ start:9213 stop:9797 length:585 start_codon:yes stop_codon:yes gene_type:complete
MRNAATIAGIGHNQGPNMERGHKFRSFQWQQARKEAMPNTIPLMVVKMHVARARALGLDYATYATVRKASGRDIMGILFSSNALRVMRADAPQMPLDRADAVQAISGAKRLALVHAPLAAGAVAAANPVLDMAAPAPKFTQTWAEMRDHLGGVIIGQKLLSDQVLIVGDTALEREWHGAARAAGYVDAARYFAP